MRNWTRFGLPVGTSVRGTNRRRSVSALCRPRLETLEERVCLSCEVLFDGSELSVRGDARDNEVSVIVQRGQSVQVVCDGVDHGTFDGVRSLRVDLQRGFDRLVVAQDGLALLDMIDARLVEDIRIESLGLATIGDLVIDAFSARPSAESSLAVQFQAPAGFQITSAGKDSLDIENRLSIAGAPSGFELGFSTPSGASMAGDTFILNIDWGDGSSVDIDASTSGSGAEVSFAAAGVPMLDFEFADERTSLRLQGAEVEASAHIVSNAPTRGGAGHSIAQVKIKTFQCPSDPLVTDANGFGQLTVDVETPDVTSSFQGQGTHDQSTRLYRLFGFIRPVDHNAHACSVEAQSVGYEHVLFDLDLTGNDTTVQIDMLLPAIQKVRAAAARVNILNSGRSNSVYVRAEGFPGFDLNLTTPQEPSRVITIEYLVLSTFVGLDTSNFAGNLRLDAHAGARGAVAVAVEDAVIGGPFDLFMSSAGKRAPSLMFTLNHVAFVGSTANVHLEGQQCLVFYLGGFQLEDSDFNLTIGLSAPTRSFKPLFAFLVEDLDVRVNSTFSQFTQGTDSADEIVIGVLKARVDGEFRLAAETGGGDDRIFGVFDFTPDSSGFGSILVDAGLDDDLLTLGAGFVPSRFVLRADAGAGFDQSLVTDNFTVVNSGPLIKRRGPRDDRVSFDDFLDRVRALFLAHADYYSFTAAARASGLFALYRVQRVVIP